MTPEPKSPPPAARNLAALANFSKVHVARPSFLIVGASAIIIANVLISLETEFRRFLTKTLKRFPKYN